jgi:hypothetical protein
MWQVSIPYGKSIRSLPTYCEFLSNSTKGLVQVPWIIAPCPYRLLPQKNPTHNFYVSLGFLSHNSNDNRLSMTSQEFQEKVKQYPKVWITPEKCEMTLFRLIKGHIRLLTVFDPTGLNLESNLTWRSNTYCKFPYACESMEKIESFANDLPIL